MKSISRPDWDNYLMNISLAVRSRANCIGSKVGFLIAIQERIISTGYNGTPTGTINCDQGGCESCNERDLYGKGKGYDVCICVHAEQNAILAAAKFGIPVDGATIYTTLQPCFGCLKESLQAGISTIKFLNPWEHPDRRLKRTYDSLQKKFSGGLYKINIDENEIRRLENF